MVVYTPTMSKQERNVVAVPQKLLDRLKKLKEQTGTNITWHVTRAIESYLNEGVIKK